MYYSSPGALKVQGLALCKVTTGSISVESSQRQVEGEGLIERERTFKDGREGRRGTMKTKP